MKTDLHNFIMMLAGSDESFSKDKVGDEFVVEIHERCMLFYFNKDEKFQSCSNKR